MVDEKNLPALRQQLTELVIAGSTDYAEEAFSEAAEKFGDLAVIEVLEALEPQVTSLHLAAFDGGKLSLATLLVPPKAWAESLAFFAAKWRDDDIEYEPEILVEALHAHIHGVIFSTDDIERRHQLLAAAAATDAGITAFAAVFSMAPHDILEVSDNLHAMQSYATGSTETDHDVVPLALELSKADIDGWERAFHELYPNFLHDPESVRATFETEEEEPERATHRSTRELLQQLRRLVPTTRKSTAAIPSKHKRLGTDIFS
jgi:hypothetical protein